MNTDSVIYYLDPPPVDDPIEEAEGLLSALGEFTVAELRELLYVAREPDFFELIRALYALPEDSRSALEKFLTAPDPRPTEAAIDPSGRCVLHRGAPAREKNLLKIVE